MSDTTLLAVNGTLMRGLELNPNMLAAGASFVREDQTAACYRIWSIGDRHPAMQRTTAAGAHVALELWSVPLTGLAAILQHEPPGLAIGKVLLQDGSVVLGVLGFNNGVKHLGALNAMLMLNLIPIIVFSIEAWLGRSFAAIEIGGAAIVIGALAANNLYLRGSQSRP